MRALTSLIFKVTFSSMIVSTPAMVTSRDAKSGTAVGSATAAIALPSKENSGLPIAIGAGFENNGMPIAIGAGNENPINANSAAAVAKAIETKMVVSEAVILYDYMSLEQSGLNEKAFEYAWRGYHNLLKKGLIRKKSVLSIIDFSQSSCSKRLYVIDVRHKKLLYRTYVAHGQNSGAEFAESFSNEPDSYKSSLGFYVTKKIYYGRNGLSLRIDGLDSGYNDQACKRNIVLHGSTYVSVKYMNNNGAIGTSLGCPAMPKTMSPKIIRIVKNGSCLFIYHPTPKYLQESTIING